MVFLLLLGLTSFEDRARSYYAAVFKLSNIRVIFSYVPHSTICLSNLLCGENEATIDQESVIILQYYSILPTLHHCFYSLFRNLYYYRTGSRPLSLSLLIFQLCLSRSSLDRICRVSLPVTFVGILYGLYLWWQNLQYTCRVSFAVVSVENAFQWYHSRLSIGCTVKILWSYLVRSPLGCIGGYYLTGVSVVTLFSVVTVGRGSQYHYLVVSVGNLLSACQLILFRSYRYLVVFSFDAIEALFLSYQYLPLYPSVESIEIPFRSCRYCTGTGHRIYLQLYRSRFFFGRIEETLQLHHATLKKL